MFYTSESDMASPLSGIHLRMKDQIVDGMTYQVFSSLARNIDTVDLG
jgi:hypothetical protein